MPENPTAKLHQVNEDEFELRVTAASQKMAESRAKAWVARNTSSLMKEAFELSGVQRVSSNKYAALYLRF